MDSSELTHVTSDDENNIQIRLSKLALIRQIFHKVFKIGLEIGAFFLQFCEWWFAHSESGPNILTNFPVPPPPKQSEKYRNICPICRAKGESYEFFDHKRALVKYQSQIEVIKAMML